MAKKRLLLPIVLLASIVVVCGALAQIQTNKSATLEGKQGALVLRGGLLIDGNGGAPLHNAVVILSDGKIASVGTIGSLAIPTDATIVDTTGKTIMPGLFDSHVHYRDFYAPYDLYWGTTTVGDLANDRGWILAYKRAIEEGRAVGPHILAVGSMLNGPMRPGWKLAPGDSAGFQTFTSGNSARNIVMDEASVEKAITEAKASGVDAIKLYSRVDPAIMKLAAQAAHRVGLPVFAHFTSAETHQGLFLGTNDIIDTGIDVYVHLYGLVKDTVPQEIRERIERGDELEPSHFMDTSKFPPLVKNIIAKKMFVNPTLLHYGAATKLRVEFERLGTDFLASPVGAAVPESRRALFLPFYKPLQGKDLEEMEEGYQKCGKFLKLFVSKGGKVVAGADGQGDDKLTQPRIPGLTLQMEMQMLHEVGLTPMQVIQAATKWGFEAWGKSKEVGTLEAGKRADVLILNRNPLDDMMATTDIYRVIQDGKVVDRDVLARWKETIPPRPDPRDNYTYGLMHVPFINEMSPESLPVNRGADSELNLTGQNFSSGSLLLINNRLFSLQAQGDSQARVAIPPGFLKQPGTYPVVVVRPGSAGGVSNSFYLMITPD